MARVIGHLANHRGLWTGDCPSGTQGLRTAVAQLRRYRPQDKAAVLGLLPVVGQRYPAGLSWLDKRLDGVRDGKASCLLAATEDGQPVGVAIETPKGRGRAKLSTLWVTETHRGRGVGSSMLNWLTTSWVRRDIADVWVTTDLEFCDDLRPSIERFGFEPIGLATGKYSPDRTEIVYGWNI